MKKASLIGFTVFFMMVGQALGDADWADIVIVPQNPTLSDVVYITLWGEWGDSCTPNASGISVVGNDIYFDVIQDYPPGIGCLTVLTPWELTESVGPLSPGIYAVYASLNGGSYTWMTDFIVTDKQFVLSTESLTVPEGGTTIFTVALLNDPYETVQATVAKQSGDPDIVVQSGASLTFDSSNYSTPRTVTLAAAEDEDYFDGITIISVSAPNYQPAEVTASEADNDMPPVLYVDIDATGNNDGRSWADAFIDLQDALSIAASYPEVEETRVAQGVYTPAGPNGNRNATFQLINGVALKGGYAGFGEPDPNARNVNVYKSTLSGDLNGNDGPNFANSDENSHHVVVGNKVGITAVLDGFTVTGGNGGSGGGMYNWKNCDLTFIDCTFSRNYASYGGGLYDAGGGELTLINCILVGNSADDDGGGLLLYGGGNLTATNCLFLDNSAREGGAMWNMHHTNLMLTNCAFSGNSASNAGGGIRNQATTNLTLTNCIFWGNHDSGGTDESAQIHGSPIVNYCCIQGWTGALGGTGNIDADPLFTSGPLGDYYLSQTVAGQASNSPCVDAGSDTAANLGMGIYTTRTDQVLDTGIVDMGYHYPAGIPDFNNDGKVDLKDFAILASQYQQAPAVPSADIAPLGGDDIVDGRDLRVLAGSWSWQRP